VTPHPKKRETNERDKKRETKERDKRERQKDRERELEKVTESKRER
jgi:hypothetical protein